MIAALRRLPPLETAILAGALAILVAIAFAGERTTPAPLQLDSYSSFDASSGGLRAFYETLGRVGIGVERFTARPAFLDRSLDTLVWAEPLLFDPRQQATTRADAAALEGWVRSGGRLLYLGHDDAAAKAGLLHLPHSRGALDDVGAAHIDAGLAQRGIARIGSDSTLRWRTPKRGVRVLVADRRGPIVVAYTFGAGTVTAAIDESLLSNDGIVVGDRPRLAVALASPGARNGRVAFDETVHGFGMPERWWQIVPRPFAIALAFAGIALLVAFAGAAMRLGPPRVPEAPDDRGTSDFIAALATLLARGQAVRQTLFDAEASTTLVIARSLGLRADAPAAEIAARIERVDLRDAFRALVKVAHAGYPDERTLVRGVALAQELRKEYAAHGRPSY